MKRREVLAATGMTLGLAGCLGSTPTENSTPTTTSEQESASAGATRPTTTDRETGTVGATPPATTTEVGTATTSREGSETRTAALTDPVSDAEFEVLQAECGTGTDQASVHRSAGRVTVEGVISGDSSCYTAELAGVRYDPDENVMTVTVRSYSTAGENEICAGCLSDIEYRASVTYDGPEPGTVVVRHNDERVNSG